jgi:hypothetical protein
VAKVLDDRVPPADATIVTAAGMIVARRLHGARIGPRGAVDGRTDVFNLGVSHSRC